MDAGGLEQGLLKIRPFVVGSDWKILKKCGKLF